MAEKLSGGAPKRRKVPSNERTIKAVCRCFVFLFFFSFRRIQTGPSLTADVAEGAVVC